MKILGGVLFVGIGSVIGVPAVLVILTLFVAGLLGMETALILLDMGKPPAVQVYCRACGQALPAGPVRQGRVMPRPAPRRQFALAFA